MFRFLQKLCDRLIYSRTLRDAIADLKAKGDFRPSGLARTPTILMICGTALLPLVMILKPEILKPEFFLRPDKSFLGSIMLLVFVGLFILTLNFRRGRSKLIQSLGDVHEAVILSVDDVFLQSGIGWFVRYEFRATNGELIRGKFKVLREELGSEKIPEPGDRITLFSNPRSPKNHIVYKANSFVEDCISKSRFQAFSNEPFSRK